MVSFTGLGSLPGTDFPAALRMTFDLSGGFPWVPELPQRGPWAGILGRGLGLPDAPRVDYLAGQWHLASSAGGEQRRARSIWRDDMEMLGEFAHDYRGKLKLAITGPWTLASNLATSHSELVLADQGARRELAEGLGHGIGQVLGALGRDIPGAKLVLQVDEPALPAVAAGAIRTSGGFFRHRAVAPQELWAGLDTMIRAVDGRASEVVLHSCAAWSGPGSTWPLSDLRTQASIDAVSFDLDQLGDADFDVVAEMVDAGGTFYAGILPSTGAVWDADRLGQRAAALVQRLGRPDLGSLVFTPACGMSGWTPVQVSAALRALATATNRIREDFTS